MPEQAKIETWPTDENARKIVAQAKLAARDLGKPQFEEMIDLLDRDLIVQEQSAQAGVSAGYGPPGEEWARRMVVLEAMLKLLRWVHQHQDAIAKVGR